MSTPPSPPTSPPEPPSPPSPPALPPMPPGWIQMEGPYYVMTSGSNCGSAMIMESSECAAAATALGLSDTTVTMSSSQYSYAPQGCTYSPATSYSSGSLYLYQYDDGSCSSTKQCICKIHSPSPPPSTIVYFTVDGPCTVIGACVRSPNHPFDYGVSQSCTITPESPAVGWLLTATAFSTESGYDKLTVNGVEYSGTTGPMGVELSGAFTWSSDGFSNRDGWEVCAQAAPPTPPPEPPSPPLPPAPPPLPPGVIQMEGCE